MEEFTCLSMTSAPIVVNADIPGRACVLVAFVLMALSLPLATSLLRAPLDTIATVPSLPLPLEVAIPLLWSLTAQAAVPPMARVVPVPPLVSIVFVLVPSPKQWVDLVLRSMHIQLRLHQIASATWFVWVRPPRLRLALVRLLVFVELFLVHATLTIRHANVPENQLRVQTSTTIVLPNNSPSPIAWLPTTVELTVPWETLEVLPVVDGKTAKQQPLLPCAVKCVEVSPLM